MEEEDDTGRVIVKLEVVEEEEDEKMMVDKVESKKESESGETESGETEIGETDAEGEDDEEAKVWRTVSPLDNEHLSSLTEYSYPSTPATSQSHAAAIQSCPRVSPNII